MLGKSSGNAQNAMQRRKRKKKKAINLIRADVNCQGNGKGVKNRIIFSDKKNERQI